MWRLAGNVLVVGLWVSLVVGFIAAAGSPERGLEALGIPLGQWFGEYAKGVEDFPVGILIGVVLFIMLCAYNAFELGVYDEIESGIVGKDGLPRERPVSALVTNVVGILGGLFVLVTGFMTIVIGVFAYPSIVVQERYEEFPNLLRCAAIGCVPAIGLAIAALYGALTSRYRTRRMTNVPRPITVMVLLVVTAIGGIAAFIASLGSFNHPPSAAYANTFSKSWFVVAVPVALAGFVTWMSVHLIRRLMHVGVSLSFIGAASLLAVALVVIGSFLGIGWLLVALFLLLSAAWLVFRFGKSMIVELIKLTKGNERAEGGRHKLASRRNSTS